jgi:hypothetical protein
MLAQPTLERSRRRELGLGLNPAQFHSNPLGPPARMLAAQSERGLQERCGCDRPWSTRVITGLQCRVCPLGTRFADLPHEAAHRTFGEVELIDNVRNAGPESDHAIDSQPHRKFNGTWHRSRLPKPGKRSAWLDSTRCSEPRETWCRNFARNIGRNSARNIVSRDRLLPSRIGPPRRRPARQEPRPPGKNGPAVTVC